MAEYCYLFHYLHPKEFCESQKYEHEILMYVDGRICNEKRRFEPGDRGSLTLDIPDDIADKLTKGFMVFDVTSSLSDPPESFLTITGTCCDRP
jgi:hypothetical protein